MRLLRRSKAHRVPANAHGQRTVDDSYFTVWLDGCGHGAVQETAEGPPTRDCFKCLADSHPREDPFWRIATPEEARAFIFELEGFSMYNGVGFRMVV